MHAAPSPIHVVLVTCPPDQADTILLTLLRRHLVGCGNILPAVRSRYWWRGELCCDEEALLIMETTSERLAPLFTAIRELHPYEVPKIVALDPSACDPAYLAWLGEVTRPRDAPP